MKQQLKHLKQLKAFGVQIDAFCGRLNPGLAAIACILAVVALFQLAALTGQILADMVSTNPMLTAALLG